MRMEFDVADLISFGAWGAEARAYLEAALKGRLAISAVTAAGAKGLARLRRKLKAMFHRHQTTAEQDFHRLQDLHRRSASRQWMKVFLSPHANKGTDPYPHLPRFFSPAKLREIHRRPDHSADQVEYIIALRAAETDCDAELRAMLYKLFGVAITNAASPSAA